VNCENIPAVNIILLNSRINNFNLNGMRLEDNKEKANHKAGTSQEPQQVVKRGRGRPPKNSNVILFFI
jgi:hypothetical protein